MQIKKSAKNQNILFILLFLGVIAVTLWRISFGYVSHDEAFFITIPDRLLNGDSLFIDEWQPTQLTYFLTLPFIAIFQSISESNVGICLYMRYVYISFHAVISLVIYLRFRKYGFMSVIASVLYFMFIPGDLMSPGYDSIGVDMIALSAILFSTAYNSKHSNVLLLISGFAFACAVLCCPYLALVYLLFFVITLILSIKKKKSALFSWQSVLWVTLGIAIPAITFLIFILSRASVSEIINNFKYLLMDPEHQDFSFFQKMPRYLSSIVINSAPGFWIACLLYFVELIVLLFDKKRMLHRGAYFAFSLLLGFVGLFVFGLDVISQYFTHIMFPMVFPGFIAYVLLKNKPKDLFTGTFVLGILYSVCIFMASNQAFFVISMAFSVTNLASFIFVGLLLKELSEEEKKSGYKLCIVAATLCISAQVFLQTDVKLKHVFRDSAPSALTETITEGPMMGVKTTPENAAQYNFILADLDCYNSKPSGNLLILAKQPWYYLVADNQQYACYSACIPGEYDGTIDMLKLYYQENPTKIPDYIYLPKFLSWDYNSLFTQVDEYGYQLKDETVISYKFEKQEN